MNMAEWGDGMVREGNIEKQGFALHWVALRYIAKTSIVRSHE